MKKYFLFLVYGLLLAASASAMPIAAMNLEAITGRDWMEMSRVEKGVFVFSAVQALRAYGVPLKETPLSYTSWMDETVWTNPAAMSLAAKNILAAVIYQNEPETRPALDKLKA